jgi:hypothetical protein
MRFGYWGRRASRARAGRARAGGPRDDADASGPFLRRSALRTHATA